MLIFGLVSYQTPWLAMLLSVGLIVCSAHLFFIPVPLNRMSHYYALYLFLWAYGATFNNNNSRIILTIVATTWSMYLYMTLSVIHRGILMLLFDIAIVDWVRRTCQLHVHARYRYIMEYVGWFALCNSLLHVYQIVQLSISRTNIVATSAMLLSR